MYVPAFISHWGWFQIALLLSRSLRRIHLIERRVVHEVDYYDVVLSI